MSRNPPLNDPSLNDRNELVFRIQELEKKCRRAEDALRTLEEQDRLLGNSSLFGIFVVDIEGRILRANQKMRDNLTGLYNRRYLYQSLAEVVEYAKVNGLVVSVIFMDLDHFKDVVDTYGHLNGSHAIKEVGQTIQEAIKRPAYAVAYAGDEFVVVLPNHSPEQALGQGKEIQNRIRNRVFLRDNGFEVRIRSSFGIASFPHHAENMTDLLAEADSALFVAKGAGKDRIKLAG